ncbi:thermonuclease family protein [Patescibacteria group bacterium]|nr:thermonuclease family protein [Patescibacteria group bacterium]
MVTTPRSVETIARFLRSRVLIYQDQLLKVQKKAKKKKLGIWSL